MNKYTCGFCGKEYDNYNDYAKCVATCWEKKQEQDKKEREDKLAKQKQERINRISKLEKMYNAEINSFYDDYGYIPVDASFDRIFDRLFKF